MQHNVTRKDINSLRPPHVVGTKSRVI